MLRRFFGIDLRSLGAFRIALGLILLFDLAIRGSDFNAHYGYSGVLPPDVLINDLMRPGQFSLFLISSHWFVQMALFTALLASAFCFLIGYRTRLSNVVTWILLVSLQNRNPMVLQGGDDLLRMMLFWAMFLPMGERFSADERLGAAGPSDSRVLSVASAAMLLQLVFVYVFTALLKSGKEWIPDGSAVYYALNIDQYAKPMGLWLRQFLPFMKFMTISTWYFEAFGCLLLFVPVGFVFFRVVGILGFVALHAGLFSCLELGIFPFVSSACMIPFLPSEVWDRCLPGSRAGRRVNAPAVRVSKMNQFVAGAFLFFVFAWNLDGVGALGSGIPDDLRWIGNLTRTDQYWNLFAPYPYKDDGYFVMPGKRVDGTPVDVFRGTVGEPSWEKPPLVSATYKDDRWRSLMMNLITDDYKQFQPYLAKYHCLQWNGDSVDREPDKLSEFQIFFMRKLTPPPGTPFAPPEKILVWAQKCFETN